MRPEPIETTIDRLKRYGYDGIQIMGEPRKYDWKAVRALLDKNKLKCYGSVSIMSHGRDLIHADPFFRDMTIQYLIECLDMVHALGGNIFTLVPSEVGKIVAMADADTEWAWAVEGIKKVGAHAAKHGIRIGLEHDVGLANVGVCLDAFHVNIEEADIYEAITKVGKRMVDFHVADNNRFPPGQGTLDWKKLISTLKAAGYDEQLTVEFVVPMDRSPLAKKAEAAGTTATEAELKFIRDHGSDLMSDTQYSRYVEASIKHLRANGAN
jgi:sugar phosphate isomerase/epimerase